jgi:hypothetical protein
MALIRSQAWSRSAVSSMARRAAVVRTFPAKEHNSQQRMGPSSASRRPVRRKFCSASTAFTLAIAESNKAAYCIALGDFTEARKSAREGFRFAGEAQSEGLVVSSLESFALLAVLGGDALRAARLRGYVDAQKRRLGQERTAAGKVAYGKLIGTLRDTLSEDKIKELAAERVAWSEDRAVEEALKV